MYQKFIISILALLLLSLETKAIGLNQGRDITEDYLSHFAADGGLSRAHVSELTKYKVLFVRGYVADMDYRDIFKGGYGRTSIAVGYFADQIDLLKALNVETQLVDINTAGSMPVNDQKIIEAINQSEKPVIIISQSKGGLDTMEVLLKYPAVANKVKGWLAWQSPFLGTPMADMPSNFGKWLHDGTGWFMTLIGGNAESIDEMSTVKRAEYMQTNAARLREILQEIPVISFGSAVPKISGTFNTILSASRDYLVSLGYENDGLVPEASAIIPGSQYVALEGVDHLCPVFEYRLVSCQRLAMTKSFLAMLIEQIQR